MTDSFTRPATLDDLKLLIQSLNDEGVRYFLIGDEVRAAKNGSIPCRCAVCANVP